MLDIKTTTKREISRTSINIFTRFLGIRGACQTIEFSLLHSAKRQESPKGAYVLWRKTERLCRAVVPTINGETTALSSCQIFLYRQYMKNVPIQTIHEECSYTNNTKNVPIQTIHAKMMILWNVNTSPGLFNDATGIIKEFIYDDGEMAPC